MGVTGLWTVLQPCARPIKIETLNKKRLAVDASIWIYQFLKAVRDKEGNALRNSHIVGFFRRICKLLFFGIKPVFVFDGGAPALKRQTISNRKSRREGRREDAVRTAGKLLALQMQRAAEEEEKKRKSAARHPQDDGGEDIPENVVYAEEVFQTQQERLKNRTFKRKDQYHLPDLNSSFAEMGQNDPRIMSLEELEEYARQFDRGEDINVYDFSKIDFDSPFFVSLPASDRYNILNAARLRSRLRMGYSKEQLDTMFPDRMAFSKFQIERVRERNELTQRLMNLDGPVDDAAFGVNGTSRVAGEKGREYVLVKNDGVEGGWALGVVSNNDEGQMHKPIELDLPPPVEEEWEDDEDEFEDVPIEGLNRLPRTKSGLTEQEKEGRQFISRELAKRRQKVYNSRKDRPLQRRPRRAESANQDPDSLFFAEEDDNEEWEEVPTNGVDELLEHQRSKGDREEEEHLQQAIALSLRQDGATPLGESEHDTEMDDDYHEVFHQERAQEINPFSGAKGSGLAIARMANQRSSKVAIPKVIPKTPFNASDSEDDEMDLQAALAESRRSKRPTSPRSVIKPSTLRPSPTPPAASNSERAKAEGAPGFDGPLPFERLNLGSSILGKKKMQQLEEANAGGFEKPTDREKNQSAEPLPPWFEAKGRDIREELTANEEVERQLREQDRKADQELFQFQDLPKLRKQETQEVIDLEAPSRQSRGKEVFIVDSSDDEEEEAEKQDVMIDDPTLRMGDLAERARVEPPKPLSGGQISPPTQDPSLLKPSKSLPMVDHELAKVIEDDKDEPIDWSESEPEAERAPERALQSAQASPRPVSVRSESETMEFEDVPIDTHPPLPSRPPSQTPVLEGPEDLLIPIPPIPASGVADDYAPGELPDDESDQYSDPEDAELFASLAAEGEEHARFASELNNNKSAPINFDEELRQLRAQQKKDRRDADEVTQTMISECQHLLTLFGLPYVTAPMEAEAQCAELVSLGLVDGIVTDDSDTFLFGGTRVYKNMFNAAKYVECYLSNDLTIEFSLTREKLIAIAQLLGSDYTTGIPGIGPVTALEIISEFGTLQAFRDWWDGVQKQTIPKEADKTSQFRRRFRRSQNTKLFLPTNFPDPRVAEAYLHPDVDSDPQPFQWGVPDLDALRKFLSSQIGWSSERTDEVLVPVIKDMNRREKEGTQSNITRFFDGAVGAGSFAPRVRDNGTGPSGKQKGKGAAGKRLGAALTRLAERDRESRGEGEADTFEGDDVEEAPDVSEPAPATKKRKGTKRSAGGEAQSTVSSEDVDGDDEDGDGSYAEPRKKARKSRKRNDAR